MYTVENLAGKSLKELKEIAKALDVKPRHDLRLRKTWIDALIEDEPKVSQTTIAFDASSVQPLPSPESPRAESPESESFKSERFVKDHFIVKGVDLYQLSLKELKRVAKDMRLPVRDYRKKSDVLKILLWAYHVDYRAYVAGSDFKIAAARLQAEIEAGDRLPPGSPKPSESVLRFARSGGF